MSMKTISANITDNELSALVAEHCAGWTRHEYPIFTGWTHKDVPRETDRPPPYATSADAVLPLLEKWKFVKASRWVESKWLVSMSDDLNEHSHKFLGYAPSLPRAACFALLGAVGCTVK